MCALGVEDPAHAVYAPGRSPNAGRGFHDARSRGVDAVSMAAATYQASGGTASEGVAWRDVEGLVAAS